jgi:N-acyl homoserine lactone hydrolase
MKIHAIQTGTVAVTRAWREGVGHGKRRLLNTIRDRQWTEPLPIYAFAIEHPEGVIVVDTGETARASQPGSTPTTRAACTTSPPPRSSSRGRSSSSHPA